MVIRCDSVSCWQAYTVARWGQLRCLSTPWLLLPSHCPVCRFQTMTLLNMARPGSKSRLQTGPRFLFLSFSTSLSSLRTGSPKPPRLCTSTGMVPMGCAWTRTSASSDCRSSIAALCTQLPTSEVGVKWAAVGTKIRCACREPCPLHLLLWCTFPSDPETCLHNTGKISSKEEHIQ